MYRILTLTLLGVFSVALIGCEASAEVDDTDNDRDMSYKKTTTIEDDGSRTVKTEKKVERD